MKIWSDEQVLCMLSCLHVILFMLRLSQIVPLIYSACHCDRLFSLVLTASHEIMQQTSTHSSFFRPLMYSQHHLCLCIPDMEPHFPFHKHHPQTGCLLIYLVLSFLLTNNVKWCSMCELDNKHTLKSWFSIPQSVAIMWFGLIRGHAVDMEDGKTKLDLSLTKYLSA